MHKYLKDNANYVGDVYIESGSVVVSDPCYTIPTWCQGIVDNVKNGRWMGFVEYSDEGDWGLIS